MPGPLNGVRVLDLTGVVSGPFTTMFLADQGADVLKIEPIGGDITRRSRATIDKSGEFSAVFISSNRGKRSLAIDVKSEAGREVLAKLMRDTDVLAPVIIRQEVPRLLPMMKQQAHDRGIVEVVIDELGRVTTASIRQSIQPMYDADLLTRAKDWRYQPATLNGKPVKYRKMIQLNVNRQ